MSEQKLHAKYSASGSERWMSCPGSIRLSEQAGPQPDSPYAIEGVQAHTCLETILKSKTPRVAALMLEKQYPKAMVKHAMETTLAIHALRTPHSEFHCETRVALDFVRPGMFGTVDAAIVELFGTLWVIDYKYGAGRLVSPEQNSQMIYYALGLAHLWNYNFETVRLAIAQPRIVHKDGWFRHWDMDIPALRKWADKFKRGVEACEKPNAPLKPGRWCFFCSAQVICPAIGEEKFNEAQEDFSGG